jgi:hypothetical protein
MAIQNGDTVLMEGIRIVFRNFSGKEGQYNAEGTRTFSVLIDDSTAHVMAEDGWNVKWLQPRENDEDEEPQAFLPVALRFDVFPPRVVLVTSRGRTTLHEDTVEMLDWANIQNVDLIVRANVWKNNSGKSGVKAYVKSLYVTIEEDALELKYGALDTQETELL